MALVIVLKGDAHVPAFESLPLAGLTQIVPVAPCANVSRGDRMSRAAVNAVALS